MKNKMILLFGLIIGFLLSSSVFAYEIPKVAGESRLIYSEDFEDNKDFASYDHYYTGHEGEIISKDALSGNNSLAVYVTEGKWVDTLAIKKDFILIGSENAYLFSAKVKLENFQQMMVEVRKDYINNTPASMPYEFVLTTNEANTLIERPYHLGWYNPLDAGINIYDELYEINDGIINFQFAFKTDAPVVFSIRGVVRNEAEVAIMTFDDIALSEKPLFTEDFEMVPGQFWDDTVFWANNGGLTTDIAAVIGGKQSLGYNIQSWALGGITNTKLVLPRDKALKMTYKARGINAKQFQLATPWSPVYFEIIANFETETFSSTLGENATGVFKDGVLTVTAYFTIPSENTDLQTFNFYGDRIDESAVGFVVIDDFSIEVVGDRKPVITPKQKVGYLIEIDLPMTYYTNLLKDEVLSIKHNDVLLDLEKDILVSDGLFVFDEEYLTNLGYGKENVFVVETTLGNYNLSLDIYDLRPTLTPANPTYQLSFMQDLLFELDSHEQSLVGITLDGNPMGESHGEITPTSLLIYKNTLKDLALGEHELVLKSTGGTRKVMINVVAGSEVFAVNNFDYNKDVDNDLVISHNLPNEHLASLKLNGNLVEASDYELSANSITLSKALLGELSSGVHTLSLVTKTEGVSFDVSITVSQMDPKIKLSKYVVDVKEDKALAINVELYSATLVKVLLNDVLVNHTFDNGVLTIARSEFDKFVLGEFTLSLETSSKTIQTLVELVNTSALNSVIEITVPADRTVYLNGNFDPLSGVSIKNNIGEKTVYVSEHLDASKSGVYVVTIVVVDQHGNTSFAYYKATVLSSKFTINITYLKELFVGGKHEAIYPYIRKFNFSI